MLLCQICKQREATVHVARIISQQRVDMYVCEQCAKETYDIKINLNKLLHGIMGMDSADSAEREPLLVKQCEACGMTISEFNKIGILGCPQCYTAFGSSIETMLKRIHGNVKHHGKIPGKLSGKIQEKRTLDELKARLQQCIKEENYEQAAQIRDEIRQLEKKKANGGDV